MPSPTPQPGRGRPTKYLPEYADHAYNACLLWGATDEELARFFEVSPRTIDAWKAKQPRFAEALREGKGIADAQVARRMYELAMGYEHDETKLAQHEGRFTDAKTVTRYYPPNYQAASLWLRNRQPQHWRDKLEVESSGIPLVIVRDFTGKNRTSGDDTEDSLP